MMHKIIHWLIVLLMPVFLGFGVIRAVIAWDYPAWEYGRIAPDAYGWTPEERLELAQATLAYMQRPEPAEQVIYLLEALRLPEDPSQPLYNEREIEHMLDVKHLTDGIRDIFWPTAVLVLAGLAFLWATPGGQVYGRLAIYRGGLATVGVLTAIALFIVIGWSVFFVFFHELLFPPGTWTFYYTDSLIRLFPEQFWFDMGLILSLTPLALGGLLTAVGYFLRPQGG